MSKVGFIQIGSTGARLHDLSFVDICPAEGGEFVLTFIGQDKEGKDSKRVRVWLKPGSVPELLRTLFGEITSARADSHPEVLRLAKMVAALAERREKKAKPEE